jgi:hypothetical protein
MFGIKKEITEIKSLKLFKSYPKGKVPKDFSNWYRKINGEKNIEHVESFPFRKSVKYSTKSVESIDENGRRFLSLELIRIF